MDRRKQIKDQGARVQKRVVDAAANIKPKLRGVSHEYAFFLALGACIFLIATAPSTKAQLAAVIYSIGLCGLLGVSALYHRITWAPEARKRMRRLDHSMIFVLIAGTYTPFALLVFQGTLATVMILVIWGAALLGIVLKLTWIEAPKWLTAVIYIAMGWVMVFAMPQFAQDVGTTALVLLLVGGVLYTFGGLIYALKWPNPFPRVFGYHEVFHALVIIAAAIHFVTIAQFVLPIEA